MIKVYIGNNRHIKYFFECGYCFHRFLIGHSNTDYLTACGLQKEIVIIDGLEEVVRQQKAIGRNLNQLTALANIGKINVVFLQELTDAYAQVSSFLSGILKRRRWG